MANIHETTFRPEDRPRLDGFESFDISEGTLRSQLGSLLKTSLETAAINSHALATSARLWEDLLEQPKNRIPTLLLLVADVRWALNHAVPAISLYREVRNTVNNGFFSAWVDRLCTNTLGNTKSMLAIYKDVQRSGFTPSQKWRPGTANDPFPHCKMPQMKLTELQNMCHALSSETTMATEEIMQRYLNYHSLHTNVIEGTVTFDHIVTAKLVEFGFYNQNLQIGDENIEAGAVRRVEDALPILRDTHKTLSEIFEIVKAPQINITVGLINQLHYSLMRSSRILFSGRLTYIGIGATRQTTQTNVVIGTPSGQKVQCCPFDSVDSELATFCVRYNELVNNRTVDPFAAAAWISHAFVAIHPFEDGNGRMSRILSSIPLVKHGLPPINVLPMHRLEYFVTLNQTRSLRDGDYSELMGLLYRGTYETVRALRTDLLIAAAE